MRIELCHKLIRAASVAGAATLALACNPAAGSSVPRSAQFGVWLIKAGDAKVLVGRCGAAICGKVVWLKQPIDSPTRKPQADDKNQIHR